MKDFNIDWSALIVEIVKKKDLDCDEFRDCWEDVFDWTELDLFIIKNYRDLLIKYGEVEAERINFKGDLEKDLQIYEENLK